MIRELLFGRQAVPTWIALAALFVALGGPAAAVDLVSNKKIPGKKIKAETITAKQVKDGTLTEVELSPAAAAALRAVGPDAVTGAEVVDASLGGADLGDGSVGGGDLADDAIDAAKVRNRSLGGADVGRYSGTFSIPFPSIAAGACNSQTTPPLVPIPNGQDVSDDAIVLTPPPSFPATALSVEAQGGAADKITITLCNRTGAPVVPGSPAFRYVTIDVSGS